MRRFFLFGMALFIILFLSVPARADDLSVVSIHSYTATDPARAGKYWGVGMAWASQLFGVWVWVYGFLLTYTLWGVFGLLVTITGAINSQLKRIEFRALGMRSLLDILAVGRGCRRSASPCEETALGRLDGYGNTVDKGSELTTPFPA